MIKKDTNKVSSALLAVGALQGAVALLGWSIYSPGFTTVDWLITFSFIIFIALGLLACWLPLVSALTAIVVYASFLILQGCLHVKLFWTGLVFKVPIIVLLILAVVLSFSKARDLRGHP